VEERRVGDKKESVVKRREKKGKPGFRICVPKKEERGFQVPLLYRRGGGNCGGTHACGGEKKRKKKRV